MVTQRVGRALTRRRLAVVGTLAVVVAGAAVAVRTLDVHAVLDAARTANPALLGAAAVVYLCSWPLRGRRYADILRVMGHRCGTRFLTAAIFLSQTANLAVPARAGDGARAYVVNARRQVPYATGAASLALERLFDLVAIALLGSMALAGLLVAGETGGFDRAVLAAGGVGALALVGLAGTVALARSNRALGTAIHARVPTEGRPRLARLTDAAVRFGRDLALVAADTRALAVVGLGSLAIWTLDVLTAVVVLAALDTGLGLWSLAVAGTLAVSVGNLAKVIPLSQGGIGLYEAAFTGVVVAVTPVGAAVALAAALVDHALKNAVTLAGGALAALWLNVSPTAAAADG